LGAKEQWIGPDEPVLVEMHPHWMYLFGPLAVSLVVIAAGVTLDIAFPHTSVDRHWLEGGASVPPLCWLAARFVRWRRTLLVVTPSRIVELRGVFTTVATEVWMDEILRVRARSGLFRRLLGYGRLECEVVPDEGDGAGTGENDGAEGIGDVDGMETLEMEPVAPGRGGPYPGRGTALVELTDVRKPFVVARVVNRRIGGHPGHRRPPPRT